MIDVSDIIERLMSLGYTVEGDYDVNYSIEYAIKRSEGYIKNFCNLVEIPDELREIAIDMACGYFMRERLAIGHKVNDLIEFNEGVSSIKEGDLSIEFNNDESNEGRFKLLLDRLCNRDKELVSFRKLRW